ncbi:MAG: LuxR C-terminal-related transcriptional regulator, partial [Anaerolineae bacterium]
GSHRLVLDYLIEEVLEQQSEDVQTFLLQTAVLDRLTGSLCDAVRFGNAESAHGEDSGQATLEMLERANLFIVPLDAERRWYRYHELFADLLRRQLRHTEPGSIPTLHRRASAWYEQKGLADEAIDHALRGEDFEKAARLIEGRADAMWQHGQHAKLRRWLDELPVELMLSKPHLCILRAWMFFTSGQQDAAEQSLEAAEKALRVGAELAVDTAPGEQGRLSPSERMKIQGRAATIRAFLAFYRGDTRGTDEYARQALDYLPEDDLTWRSAATVALGDAYSFVGDLAAACRVRSEALDLSQAAGNIYIVLIASMKLAVTLRQQGRLEQVIEICRRQLRLANRSGLSQTDVVGWLLAIQSEVLAERDDLEEALDKAECGTELTKRGTDLATLGWSYLCLVRILFSIGDYHAAGEAVRRMEEIAGESYVPPWITSIGAAWRARIWLAQGNLEAALQWAEERGLNPDAPPPYLFESEYVALARILVAQGRLDEAAKLLQRLLEAAEKRGHTSRTIEVLVLQGMAFQAAGDTEEALTALERALTLAEPEGFVRTFVDEGPPVGRLLYEAAKGELAPDYARRLLAAFPAAETEQTVGPDTQDARHEMIELLSRRELQVLQLIAEGLTNREIAARLFLSLNTVKVHTRNIYGKLNVHSRTQAVARSQAMGLLPRA